MNIRIIKGNIISVPEFCDDTCALLADPEDFVGMADMIE